MMAAMMQERSGWSLTKPVVLTISDRRGVPWFGREDELYVCTGHGEQKVMAPSHHGPWLGPFE